MVAYPKVQIVTLSDPEVYGEYKLYEKIHSVRELFEYVIKLKP